MWTALVVSGVALAILRLVYVVGLGVNTKAFMAVVRRFLAAGDLDRCLRLCSAADVPLTRAVAGMVRAAEQPEATREELERAFASAFQAASARVSATRWVPLIASVAIGCGLALAFAQVGVDPRLAGAAVAGAVVLVVTSHRLAAMLSTAGAVRDELADLLLAPRVPYRGSIEPLRVSPIEAPAAIAPVQLATPLPEPHHLFFAFGARDPQAFVAALAKRLPTTTPTIVGTPVGTYVAVSGVPRLLREIRAACEELALGDEAPDATVGPEARGYPDLVEALEGTSAEEASSTDPTAGSSENRG